MLNNNQEQLQEHEQYFNNMFSEEHYLRGSNDNSVINATLNEPRSISINVFQGGKDAVQIVSFKMAIKKFQESSKYRLSIKYYTCDHIKALMLSEKQFVDLMLDCDLHFIITHIHQNMERLNWNMNTLYQEIQRLQAHNGFPTGPELECPIFTQNKIEYLRCLLPLQIANPTLKISFNDRSDFENCRNQISSFVNLHKNQEGCGFVLKKPFVTNSKNIYIKNESADRSFTNQIIQKIGRINNDNYGICPYIMLQPCMKNRKENKVVTFDGKARYVCAETRRHNSNKSFSKAPHTELFEFAESAVLVLAQSNPAAITSSLVRVDVFQNNIGQMVVNEFESLEAAYYCGDRNGVVKENRVTCEIAIFYMNILSKYFEL